VTYVIGSFRLPDKAVFLPPAADCLCIREVNKMVTPQEKVQFFFSYDVTKSATIVQRPYRTLEKNASSENSITEG
jgi:hypothetical protein